MSRMERPADVGIVVIGRNEGKRLEICLNALKAQTAGPLVYVDSGSTDGSVEYARNFGVRVIELDMSVPFTAGRARDTGFTSLIQTWPDTEFVQFVDSDCEIDEAWCEQAIKFLVNHQDAGIVVGRLRERYRNATNYNLMIDLEWDRPIGNIESCVGTHAIRVASYIQAGGYNPNIIAAEDDELCFRVRQAGWKVFRLDTEMAIHDVAMSKFSEWWRRSVRAGHGFAQVGHLHREYFISERRRTWFWGGVLPSVAIGFAPITGGVSITLFALFLVSFVRTRNNLMKSGISAAESKIYAKFLTISKFPNLIGMLKYWYKYALNQKMKIIEYK